MGVVKHVIGCEGAEIRDEPGHFSLREILNGRVEPSVYSELYEDSLQIPIHPRLPPLA